MAVQQSLEHVTKYLFPLSGMCHFYDTLFRSWRVRVVCQESKNRACSDLRLENIYLAVYLAVQIHVGPTPHKNVLFAPPGAAHSDPTHSNPGAALRPRPRARERDEGLQSPPHGCQLAHTRPAHALAFRPVQQRKHRTFERNLDWTGAPTQASAVVSHRTEVCAPATHARAHTNFA